MDRHDWSWPGPLALGISPVVLCIFPALGLLVASVGVAMAVWAFRRNPYDRRAILILSINSVALSLTVAAVIWSVLNGLYGVVVEPWPA